MLHKSLFALAIAIAIVIPAVSSAQPATVRLHAAGSLREAFTQIAQRFEQDTGVRVTLTFGASGLLRERLSGGEASEVFASANIAHPQSLADAGKAGPVRLFARNQLCALVARRLAIGPEQVLATMLDPAVKLGTSTPKADPSGDYAWQLFERAEAVQSGARARLEAKALKLTGGPDSPAPPPGRNVYGLLVERGDAELFLTYCTNAVLAQREVASLHVVALPSALAVGADYGLVTMKGASADGARLADYLLGPRSREVLESLGFGLP